MEKYKIFISLALALLLPVAALAADSDHDGLDDEQEIKVYHTDPGKADTDGDGFPDGDEVKGGFSPRHGNGLKLVEADSDSDYLNDAWEIAIGTDLLNPDTDGDLYLDGTEVAASFSPFSRQPDIVQKLIKVSLKDQSLEYFFGSARLEKFPISSGIATMPTPKGQFQVLAKYPSKDYGGSGYNFYYPDPKWNLHFTTQRLRYYIHGAYWHNNFGKPMSHGCVNVHYENMGRLYWFAQIGTPIIIE